jgi:hypothetical protein
MEDMVEMRDVVEFDCVEAGLKKSGERMEVVGMKKRWGF